MMEEASIDIVCVIASAGGAVFGVAGDGVVVRYDDDSVRRLTHTTRRAVDFDDVEIRSVFRPLPSPSFRVRQAAVSDDDRCVLLVSQSLPTTFGVVHLDRSCSSSFHSTAPYTEARSVDADIAAVKWFPGCHQSIAVLRSDATLSVYDASRLKYPECIYRLKREVKTVIGIDSDRIPAPMDVTFLGCVAWGWASAIVLYEDGALFLLSPILPVGDVREEIIDSAQLRSISKPLVKQLLMETMGKHLDDVHVSVPYLQGPLNEGLASCKAEAFARGKAGSAITVSFGYCSDGVASITVATSNGRLYSHAMLKSIEPKCQPSDEAMVTPIGVRLCVRHSVGTTLRLMESLQLKQKSFRDALRLDQNPGHPEILYVQLGRELMRIRVSWTTSMISDEISERPFYRSQIWRFNHPSQFLGSFHVLDAPVAIFRMEHRLYASILRPMNQTKSALSDLRPIQSSIQLDPVEDEDDVPLEDAISDLQGPGTKELKETFQKYNYHLLELGDFDEAILKLEDASAEYEEAVTELESKFRSSTVYNTMTMSAVQETIDDARSNAVILGDLEVTLKRLEEINNNY